MADVVNTDLVNIDFLNTDFLNDDLLNAGRFLADHFRLISNQGWERRCCGGQMLCHSSECVRNRLHANRMQQCDC
jgi:hypothetical protein